ncbi:hypothetical protein DESC_730010 [Desulfosarcina cetonica]|nr:hypothetical protein DESC_730010 [Desulfosarcina cetonica]
MLSICNKKIVGYEFIGAYGFENLTSENRV